MFRWQPLNLSQSCPANSELMACSPFGYFYLSFLVQLFDDTRKVPISEEKENLEHGDRIIEDINVYDKKINEEYDFIVVGAGAAGCVVANRLTEIKKWKVLLLEAGPEQPSITLVPGLSETLAGSNVDWGYSVVSNGKSCLSRLNGQCTWPRGKMMGGSTSINTLVTTRGNKIDYDDWAAAGNRGWSFKEVLHYFKKAEKNLNVEVLNRKYHGVSGPQYISRFPYIDRPSIAVTTAFNQVGLPIRDFNAAEQVSTLQSQAFSVHGYRHSANSAYVEPIRRKRKNLSVRTESTAVRLLIDVNKRVYGVEYVRKGKLFTATVTKDVIVSGGTINSAKLLLLSGIGPQEHLTNLNIPVVADLPVGKNLHDHVSFSGIVVALDNKTSTLVDNNEIVDETKAYTEMEYKKGPLSSSGPYNSLSFYKTDESLPAPDIQIQTQNIVLKDYFTDIVNYERLKIFPTVFYDALVIRIQNMVPISRGWLKLNASNPNGPPIMTANYLDKYQDIITIQKGMKTLLKLENTQPFKSDRLRFVKIPLPACKYTIWGSDDYVECMLRHYTYILSHQVGTCKMGPEWDRSAVVDPRLRVYGVSGLRVIDASIMPVVVRGNTNYPTLMIGEKGSDMVKGDWLHNYVPGYVHGVKPN